MTHPINLSVRDTALQISSGRLSAEALMLGCLATIAERDPDVRAWQHLDAQAALGTARLLDTSNQPKGGLAGVPLGIKDLMDTADMPTEYGSSIYAGHRPKLDAAVVAKARSLGAVFPGKTVTTEFATFHPGKTRNPRSPAGANHTPGGSSSGSAAAVAAGMVPVALGTQTAGSIVRPAAYCGVVGYKPTHGLLPLAGIKPLSPSLDTVGVFARTVDDAAYTAGALMSDPALMEAAQQPAIGSLKVGVCRTPHWQRADEDTRAAVQVAVQTLQKQGVQVHEFELPTACEGLTQAQIDIMAFEAAAAFEAEAQSNPSGFSPAFARFLQAGQAVGAVRFRAALALAEEARTAFQCAVAGFDALIAPSTEGVAPVGLEATGDPIFCRMWTLLGTPCVHLPTGLGAYNLPVGVTVTGARYADSRVLAVAHHLENLL